MLIHLTNHILKLEVLDHFAYKDYHSPGLGAWEGRISWMLIGVIVGLLLQQSGAANCNRVWQMFILVDFDKVHLTFHFHLYRDANQYIMCFINFIISANIVSKTLFMRATY